MLNLYLFFHCNLAFSSIEEEMRPKVIDSCYFPMIEFAERFNIPIGVELSGWTLEEIHRLRPKWIERFRLLLDAGKCELIGSGYSQLIGPLVPAEVNAANQQHGLKVYQKLLGKRPDLALVNEQAYSRGILEHYGDSGYSGVIMEWDNPRQQHPEWPSDLRYAPQAVEDMRSRTLGLLWNQSVVFQHLQRFVHGDMDMSTYVDLIKRHMGSESRALCLYGNDAEIFDFRPGRFETEADLQPGEWEKLFSILSSLRNFKDFKFHLPGNIFDLNLPNSKKILRLDSPPQPIPVKKQPKYNLIRWAVSGRDDYNINSRCFALFKKMQADNVADELNWRKLCYLWSSDFRTHITQKRWAAYLDELKCFEDKHGVGKDNCYVINKAGSSSLPVEDSVNYDSENYLCLDNAYASVRLNRRKGLAIDSLGFPGIFAGSLAGTLKHGFFDSISMAADFFSGHTVLEIPGSSRYTDLVYVIPEVNEVAEGIEASADISGFFCKMRKSILLRKDAPVLELKYAFLWDELPACSLRLLHLTLSPGAFDPLSLFYSCHNGGSSSEKQLLANMEVDQGAPVSFLVSANQALGMTGGTIVVGDKDKALQVRIKHPAGGLVGMITNRQVGNNCYTRLVLSMREFDDTAKASIPGSATVCMEISPISPS